MPGPSRLHDPSLSGCAGALTGVTGSVCPDQIRGDACPECGSCILYAEVSDDDMIRLSSGSATSCAFAIWGEGIIAAIVLVLGLMALVKVCIKWKV